MRRLRQCPGWTVAGLRLRRIGPVGGRRAPVSHTNDGKWQVSTDGGIGPVWAHSGRELFYKSGDLMSVEVLPGEGFVTGERRVVFQTRGRYRSNFQHQMYDVSPDDQRFVMLRGSSSGQAGGEVIVVENFFEEWKAKVGN